MGEAYALLSTVFFAFAGIVLKRGMRVPREDNGMLLSVFLNFLMYGAAYAVQVKISATPAWSWRGVAVFAVAGVVSYLIARSAHFEGVRHLGPVRAVAVRASSPIFTLLISLALLNQGVTLGALIGTALVLTGVGAVTLDQTNQPAVGSSAAVPRGILFGLTAAAAYGTSNVLRKVGLSVLPNPLLGALIGTVVGQAVYLGAAIVRGQLWATLRRTVRGLNWEFTLAGIFLGLGQLMLFQATQLANVAKVAALTAAEPVLVVAFSSLLLRKEERFSWHILGAVLLVTVGSVILVTVK